MWRNPSAVSLAVERRAVPTIAIAVAIVTTLGALDALTDQVVLGTLTIGPGIAAGSGRPRAVLAVGAYAFALINVLAWWPDRIWGSAAHLIYCVVAVGITAVGVGIAVQIRAARRALVRAENHWRALAAVVTHSDDAIVAGSLEGRFTAYNAGAERLFGGRAEDVVGTLISEFGECAIPEEAKGQSPEEVLSRFAAGEKSIRFETVRAHRNGTVKEVSVVLSPVYDELGTVIGVSSVTRDISAQKRAEARSQQSERMASLGQLAGGVAHDFNNLLGIMLSFITFAEEAVTDPAVRGDLAKARLAGERAVDLTRQLLTFTRQDTVQRRNLDVNVCIAEAHAMLARTIEENVQLVAKPSPHPLTINADPGQIQQVLVNLAVNSRDAMPAGGTLIIEASEADLDDRQADLHPVPVAGRYVRLLVSDTGTGMSADVAARVFEPFYTTKPKGHGTGLGLATVYGIIAEGGGSVNVYSEPGIGTTIKVYFPLVTDAVAPPPSEPVAAAPVGQGRTVLVVEDEQPLGEAVARMLNDGGYRTLSAGDGPQALRLDRSHGCDLLLTDVIMPEMSGRQLAEKMLERHPGLPVLYMSGYSDGLLGHEHVLDDGIEFIEKPFSSASLLTRVGGMLPVTAALNRTG